METIILSLLDQSILLGLDEQQFWDMTVAEVVRWSKGVAYRKTQQSKEIASITHLLPRIISLSIGKMFDNKIEYPTIDQVFPELFESDPEEERRKQIERSSAQIIQFANSHNLRLQERQNV